MLQEEGIRVLQLPMRGSEDRVTDFLKLKPLTSKLDLPARDAAKDFDLSVCKHSTAITSTVDSRPIGQGHECGCSQVGSGQVAV
jgi:hypothetical protein